MRFSRLILFSIPLIILALSQSGCLLAAAAAGTGAGVAYVKGKSTDVVESDPRSVAQATVAAMKTMDILVISQEASDVEATIDGHTPKDAKIHVTVKRETDRTSKIFIRAGMFGDEVMQARLLEEIRKNL